MPIPVRPCGKQGLKLSVQGLGAMGMSAFYKRAGDAEGDEESLATLRRALELGVTHIDTSDIYGPFVNEALVGKAIAGKRERYTIATKCGIEFRDGAMAFDGSRAHVRKACEASLKRLGVDSIDLYYLHRVDPKTPVAETFAEFALLIKEGKIKHAGISEACAADIRAAHAVCPLSAVQLEWSLWTRDAEVDLVPVCRELGIGIVAYSPLGRGVLTGALTKLDQLSPDDWRLTTPRFQAEAFQRNLALVEAVKAMAAKKGCAPGQLALAWVHAQGDDVFPIPGTKRVKYLEENAGAVDVKLSAAEVKELSDAFPPSAVVGERYEHMGFLTYHYGDAK